MAKSSGEVFIRLGVTAALMASLAACSTRNEDDGVIIGGPAAADCRSLEDQNDPWDSVATWEFSPVTPGEVCGVKLMETDKKIIYIRISSDLVQVVNLIKEDNSLVIVKTGNLPTIDSPFEFMQYEITGRLSLLPGGNFELWYSTMAHIAK